MASLTDIVPHLPTRDARDARAARLEARLAVYAQYAAVVAEQAAATLGGDEARAAVLDEARERVAEHFGELCTPAPMAGTPSFRAALDDALAELAHQGAVDSALGARLAALREAVVRGAAWGAGDDGPALLALPAPAVAGATATEEPAATETADPDPVHGVFGGALTAARAAGIGGALGGQYPGRLVRDEYPAGLLSEPLAGQLAGHAVDGAAGLGVAPDGPRVDIRF